MSEKIEKLLALAFDIRTQESEANNAFSLARKLLGDTSIPDFLGLGLSKTEKNHEYSVDNLPASHKDNYIEYFIGCAAKFDDIRITSVSIISKENLVTTPSKIIFKFSYKRDQSKDKLMNYCKKYVNNYNDKLKQNFNSGMDNVGASKPYQNTTPPPRQNTQHNESPKPKEGFWKRAWKWIKEN